MAFDMYGWTHEMKAEVVEMHEGKLMAGPTFETSLSEIETGILTDILCFMRSPPC
jgi:hypothetical protein